MGINYDEEEVYDYRLTKEYNWNVKNKASKGYEENFFFCFRPNEGVFYNELETRVRLSKRVKGSYFPLRKMCTRFLPMCSGRDQKTQHSNTILAVKHRKMDENEIQAQEMRKQVRNLQYFQRFKKFLNIEFKMFVIINYNILFVIIINV